MVRRILNHTMKYDKENRVMTCYIGNNDPHEWLTSSEGKAMVMPVLTKGCEELVDSNKDEKKVLRVESIVRRTHTAHDFWVRKKDIGDTLEKIMDWALDTEEYEICARIKKIEDKLQEF